MRTARTLALLSAAILLGASTPCIWDKDTLGDELRGLPGAFDLVTGRWFHHARKYYQKRIDELPAHLRQDPDDLAAYDDLAVAYERVRDRDRAIAVMEQKAAALDRLAKAGKDVKEQRYRYHANLGTFYAHSGRFAEAVVELEKAVKINPEAHFGRERFQIDLIKYIGAARKDEALWSKHNFLTWSNYQLEKLYWSGRIAKLSFSERIKRDRDRTKHRWTTFDKAYTAVAGMLRFGGLEGSELFRVAGDLFLMRRDLHLAWWSYQRALERGHPAKAALRKAIASIEKHWKDAQRIVGGVRGTPNAGLYREVRGEADRWRKVFRTAEEAMLAKGEDTSTPEALKALVGIADAAVPRRKFPASKKGRIPRAREQQARRRGR